MSSAAARFNEGFLSESYQDASTVSMELDKGLRSPLIGEQCEAIVRFPKLFEKYPFPIVINSNFLKLAEFFRLNSNLFRLWVLRVCQQSEKHLEKISNVDEFVKRIFTVIHSNDPVARALTLRTLGSVACVIPEKQQIHHAIRQALDSHDTVEVEAAIYASVQFAAQSKSFAVSMCSKVASMIESLQTPINMKLQLIPVLRHMYHDASTAALVKTLCINLLPKYPSTNFTIVTLDSLSQLSCATLVDIPDQVYLLIRYLEDPRKKVRFQVLHSLQSLAEKGAHLWPSGSVKSLISVAKSCSDVGNEQSLMLSVVLTLTKCPLIAAHCTSSSKINDEKSLILELCSTCLVLEHHKASSLAVAILTSLITYCNSEQIPPPQMYLDQINLHHESLIYSCLMDDKLLHELGKYLKCGIQLAENNAEFCEYFVELIGNILTEETNLSQKQSIMVCETMAALCSQYTKDKFLNPVLPEESDEMDVDVQPNRFHELLPSLLKRLEDMVQGKYDQKNSHFIEILSAVCLQSMIGFHISETMLNIFEKVLNVVNNWSQYRIARSASRYGHHFIAAKIYQKLTKHVSQEKFYFYLSALTQISVAECTLLYGYDFEELIVNFNTLQLNDDVKEGQMNIVKRLEKSVTLYWKALANLKATSSHVHALSFQTEYVWLRASFLEALLSIAIARNTQYITPPPAIAQTLAQNSRDNLQKFGHVTNQFRKCVKAMKMCEENYSVLYKSAFDADPCTLEHLEITQFLCAILGFSLEMICFTSSSESFSVPSQGNYPETAFVQSICKQIAKEIENIPVETGNVKTITSKHTEVILKQIEMAIKSPVCMPRYFFQELQNTSIKLSLSPFPRISGEPIVVQAGHALVVKVEGVIQNSGSKPSLYRSIQSVQLTLTSQLLTPRPNDSAVKPMDDTITLLQTVKPHRDFLSGSFLLALNNSSYMGLTPGEPQTYMSAAGQWQVSLEACIIDENGILWNTPSGKNTLIIRVPPSDDPTNHWMKQQRM